MSMECYELMPRDVLFFRDARPMDIDQNDTELRNIGHGSSWPRPDHLYNAVMHAVIGSRVCGEAAEYGKHQDVRVQGPFPMRGESVYFPRPLDWDMLIEPCVGTDLPGYLKFGFIDRVEGKKSYPAWISADDYRRYLSGKIGAGRTESELDEPGRPEDPLFCTESRVSTTIDSLTGASKRVKGKASGQYQADYLRLGRGVSMWCGIDVGKNGDATRIDSFILGGQGGMVSSRPCGNECTLERLFPCPDYSAVASASPVFVKWTLLAPAYFARTGWLPGWCEDSTKGISDEARRDSRGNVKFPDCEGVRLVGACVGKAQWFSGWDTQSGVKPTRLVVPAGSAYLFECPDAGTAQALASRLHLKNPSDLGSQGFGLGVCSPLSRIAVNRMA